MGPHLRCSAQAETIDYPRMNVPTAHITNLLFDSDNAIIFVDISVSGLIWGNKQSIQTLNGKYSAVKDRAEQLCRKGQQMESESGKRAAFLLNFPA